MKKVALIGAGQIAETVHAAYYNTQPETYKIVAVVDPRLEVGENFAKKNNVAKAYSDMKEMLTIEKPDIVSVCTPNRFHYENVMMALEAGCHVFCEKPPAMTSAQALKMAEKATEKKVILAYDFQHRYSDETQMIKSHIDKLGEVYFVDAMALRRSGVPGWGNFIDKELQGGGPLIDYGIHMLDTTLYLLDYPEISAVQAHSFQKIGTKKSKGTFGTWDPTKYTVEDAIFGVIELKNGGIIRINTSFALNIQPEKIFDIQLCGDEAGASLYPGKIYRDYEGELQMLKEVPSTSENIHFRSMATFTDAVLGNSQAPIANASQGYTIQRLIEALYQAAESGEKIPYAL
ncbi:Gfo/Idh/MocA family protein [Lactococcus garvieae]|uniref:Gfo/Idh/MocA family protein n=1 Tax=Lactococcus garvieae TaxID=1363 RepID=UPI0018D621CC|nr:Gfo/Idh/MocA family oxidoreductase [Lactococcus garvieae]QPS71637.1 Gfo/Idh/MocA family oxidoreductase [Lactococcus garvieae]